MAFFLSSRPALPLLFSAKNPDSVFFSFFLASRTKNASVIAFASPPVTFVLVAMQKRWFTRRRGTPLTAYGPVTSSRPLSSCFRNTTRRPRKRPASRTRMEPGSSPFFSLGGVADFLPLPEDFTFVFLPKTLGTHLACPALPMAPLGLEGAAPLESGSVSQRCLAHGS